jgi:hypothetical protein
VGLAVAGVGEEGAIFFNRLEDHFEHHHDPDHHHSRSARDLLVPPRLLELSRLS